MLHPLHYTADGTESREGAVSRWLIAVSALVLVAGCANVLNLMLARGARRHRERAVQLAMGCSRRRLALSEAMEVCMLVMAAK